MSRVKIELPDHLSFKTALAVRIGDLNYGNHLANDAVLAFVHEARVQFLASLGYSELDVEGVGLIMADTAIVYKLEGFLGDELEIEVGVDNVSKVAFDLYYRLTKKASGKEVALVKTGMVCFDYKTRKVAALPEEAKARLIS